MLVCGEDLGFVPACVPPVMHELGLIGLRIQRMASEPGAEFNNPANYPYLSVASPSCHDVTPVRAWYEEDAQRRDRFYYSMLLAPGDPPEACTPEVVRIIVQQHLSCPSVWTVFPMQDLMALSHAHNTRPPKDEIINDPTVTKHYWRYRMHVSVEDLAADAPWVQLIKGMLADSGRM
jgi:4-alpha-glucanotransferase